jgi:hypothetical protein
MKERQKTIIAIAVFFTLNVGYSVLDIGYSNYGLCSKFLFYLAKGFDGKIQVFA